MGTELGQKGRNCIGLGAPEQKSSRSELWLSWKPWSRRVGVLKRSQESGVVTDVSFWRSVSLCFKVLHVEVLFVPSQSVGLHEDFTLLRLCLYDSQLESWSREYLIIQRLTSTGPVLKALILMYTDGVKNIVTGLWIVVLTYYFSFQDQEQYGAFRSKSCPYWPHTSDVLLFSRRVYKSWQYYSNANCCNKNKLTMPRVYNDTFI